MSTLLDLRWRPLRLPELPSLGIMSYIGPPAVIPKDCWDAFFKLHTKPKVFSGMQTATTPEQIGWMLSELFSVGIAGLRLNLNSYVQHTETEILIFLGKLMRNGEPPYEHKNAFAIYLLSQCCSSIEWVPK